MANFYKHAGMDATGFDKDLTKQTLLSNGSAEIALFGGDGEGAPLKVTSNNPGVIDINEGERSIQTYGGSSSLLSRADTRWWRLELAKERCGLFCRYRFEAPSL